MIRVQITVPWHLCNRPISVPFDPVTKIHAKEPKHLAIHRMLGFAEQQEGRTVWCRAKGDELRLSVTDGDGEHLLEIPRVRLYAVLAYLEGYVLNRSLEIVKSCGGEVDAGVTSGIMDSAKRKIMNAWEADENPWPWGGVGVIAVSPDGQEFGFVRKDQLHPRMNYSCRLAVVGGGMDSNEVLSAWGREAECAAVSMYRECFEEVRDLQIATEMAEACQYFGAARANCYLYEDSGHVTPGCLRFFAAQASTNEAWDRWRRLYIKENNLLGEANPEILTRDQLLKVLEADSEAARARKEFLKTVNADALHEAEAPLLERFSRSAIMSKLKGLRPSTTEAELKAEVNKIWRFNRDEAFANGEFPLRHRGDFAFISGMAGPVAHVLKGAHIID